MEVTNQLELLCWADIRAEAVWVKPLILNMEKTLSNDWKYEDVYSSCLNNKAQLFVGKGVWEEQGFVVLQSLQNPYTLQNTLFIWLAHGKTHGLYPEFYPDLRRIANHTGCTSITFKSPRKGWVRATQVVMVEAIYQIPMEECENV